MYMWLFLFFAALLRLIFFHLRWPYRQDALVFSVSVELPGGVKRKPDDRLKLDGMKPGEDYALISREGGPDDEVWAAVFLNTGRTNHITRAFSVSSETPADGVAQLGEMEVLVEGTTDAKQKLYDCFLLDSELPTAVSDTQSTVAQDLTAQDQHADDQHACMRDCTLDRNCYGWAWFDSPREDGGSRCVRWGQDTSIDVKAASIQGWGQEDGGRRKADVF
ncbi:unnamed protein product, partial [Amoebophrya sp. A120]|eukprot:GSA120T00013562001.1